MRQMADGVLDFAVMYTPRVLPGLMIEKLFDENIVLVSTVREPRNSSGGPGRWQKEYVFVDWGAEYSAEHTLAWPDMATPAVYFGIGTVALEFILRQGGAGYFPQRMVGELIRQRRLFRVSRAPSFLRPVYLTRAATALEPRIEEVLDELRAIAVNS